MRTHLTLAACLLAGPALADSTITFLRQGGDRIGKAHAFIDGASIGRIRSRRNGLTHATTPGTHEVWLAKDEDGVFTWCHGLVEVPAEGDVVVTAGKARTADLVCEGATDGLPDGPSSSRGALLAFALRPNFAPWVRVDDGDPVLMPPRPFLLNLPPGTHDIALMQDVKSYVMVSRKRFELAEDEQVALNCTVAGCIPEPISSSQDDEKTAQQ